jgi:hypothetical protein
MGWSHDHVTMTMISQLHFFFNKLVITQKDYFTYNGNKKIQCIHLKENDKVSKFDYRFIINY